MTPFFSFDWEGTSLADEFSKSGESQDIPITFAEQRSVVRHIDAAMGVSYDCN